MEGRGGGNLSAAVKKQLFATGFTRLLFVREQEEMWREKKDPWNNSTPAVRGEARHLNK